LRHCPNRTEPIARSITTIAAACVTRPRAPAHTSGWTCIIKYCAAVIDLTLFAACAQRPRAPSLVDYGVLGSQHSLPNRKRLAVHGLCFAVPALCFECVGQVVGRRQRARVLGSQHSLLNRKQNFSLSTAHVPCMLQACAWRHAASPVCCFHTSAKNVYCAYVPKRNVAPPQGLPSPALASGASLGWCTTGWCMHRFILSHACTPSTGLQAQRLVQCEQSC
jgi:hypothetical protein